MTTNLNRRKFIKHGLYAGIGAISSYPFMIERYMFQINTYHIPVPNLPGAFQGFTMAQLTDFHYGFLMPMVAVKFIIKKTLSLETDIVICTGDYIHEKNNSQQIDTIWPVLMGLKARYGVYSILGNHDHWADFSKSKYWLETSGQNLRHRAVSIRKENQRIWLGGAGDFWEDKIGIDRAFHGVPSEDCKILLAHNPDTADTFFKTRVDLIVSGHTHGGQVKIPFLGAPILPVKNKKYSSGLVKSKRTNIFISKGLGWSILPVRFNCMPEVAVLKLYRGR